MFRSWETLKPLGQETLLTMYGLLLINVSYNWAAIAIAFLNVTYPFLVFLYTAFIISGGMSYFWATWSEWNILYKWNVWSISNNNNLFKICSRTATIGISLMREDLIVINLYKL